MICVLFVYFSFPTIHCLPPALKVYDILTYNITVFGGGMINAFIL